MAARGAAIFRREVRPVESAFLERLKRGVVVFDGAMGTSIQKLELSADDFGGKEGANDYLVLVKPEVIEAIHRGFLEAGADVIETDTFGGSRLKLDEYGLGDRTLELNRAAAALARRVADEFGTPELPRFVAGSIGPSGWLPGSEDPTLSNITFDQLAEVFREQAQGLIEGGADLLIIETGQDLLEVKAAVAGAVRYFQSGGRRVPLQVQVTLDVTGKMLLGTDIAAALTALEALPVDVIGLNCSTGPEHMREPIRYLAENSTRPVSCIPNAGLPLNVNGHAEYPMGPEEMAAQLGEFVRDFGIEIIGGCCGTTPEHIRQFVAAVRGDLTPRPPSLRGKGVPTSEVSGVGQASDLFGASEAGTPFPPREGGRGVRSEPRVASAMTAIPLHQDPRPLLVGERVNSQGSRAVKRLLLAEAYDKLVEIARQQSESGAHVLDVCVALTERADEAEQMRILVRKLAASVEQPLMIDSTDPKVVEVALENYAGRAIINSINLENGRERVDAVLPLAREHGAAVVAMTIDEEGMAKTAAKKLAVAARITGIATTEYGLAPEDLIFDPLTFPLSTGMEDLKESGVETLEGIRGIKRALPGVFTMLGLSNVSFGLTPAGRAVLNSVFLYHAVEAGLDLAIVNPAHIKAYADVPPEQRDLADDLIFNRRPDALARYIDYFNQNEVALGDEQADPTEGMAAEARVHWRILHRKKEGVEADLAEVLAGRDAVAILNDILLPAMKEVGDKFGAGELILPFVLQSAEVMKRCVAFLEPHLPKTEGYAKGKVVLATVFGDVHDIGKNLVNIILSNNGYTVHDLGKQVPLNRILDAAAEVGADAIGLSALLVSTSKQMQLCVQELDKRGLSYPLIIGGAAINRNYGRRISFVEGERQYAPGVFYARDAFEGLEIMDHLSRSEERAAFTERIKQDAFQIFEREAKIEAALKRAARSPLPQAGDSPLPLGEGQGEGAPPALRRPPSAVRRLPAEAIPRLPDADPHVLSHVPVEVIIRYFDKKSLFRLSWGAKSVHGADFERLEREELIPRLKRMAKEAGARGYLRPRAVYRYFPCQSHNEALILYDPAQPGRELCRFEFPRQPDRDHLCLADYFAPVDSGLCDTVALQVVTVGSGATDYYEQLNAAGEFAEALYVHGFAVQSAEALAEYTHRRIRKELGLKIGQGKRYSWGYPACPDLADHEKVLRLLPARETIGVGLTEGYQLLPEQSTAALVVHHPQAVYYSVFGAAEP
jgi:5-methyltetrahydrofolate--homocysteine methyltransferase